MGFTIGKRLRHRMRRLGQVSARDKALLVEATLAMLKARIAIAVVPFPRIARRLGGFMAPHDALAKASAHLPSLEDQRLAHDIGWAVTRAARHIPFEAVCLPQAMAAHAMLKKREVFSVIHFGTARGKTASLQAHAWLNVGDVEVTGYPLDPDFTEIACIG